MDSVFVTGGSGFLGSRLLQALLARGMSVVGLDRSGALGDGSGKQTRLEVVQGDLLDPRTYMQALATTDAAVHLAAATGKASAERHFEVNARGTEILLEQCRQAGVRKLLFVSSIATKFPDKTRYYYAQAKQRAEEAIQASGLEFTIVRPTIIIGRGSAPLVALSRLAGLPLVPVFGDGRTRVQPIYVEDLVEFIVAILDQRRFAGETLELGGPTVLTIEELLHEVRSARSGGRARTVHIPLGLLLPFLGAAEKLGIGPLPLTTGQLASFRFDGTIEPSALHEGRRAGLKAVPEMLSLSLAA